MFFLLACEDEAEPATLDCRAELSPDNTLVVGVEWSAPEGESWVEFDDGASARLTPTQGGGELHFDLVGLPPDRDVPWTGVTETADGRLECSGTTRTGAAPEELPPVWVDTGADRPGWVIGSFYEMDGAVARLAAYRRDGTLVWYHLGRADHNALDLQWARDGRGLVYNDFASNLVDDTSSIRRISWAGEELGALDTPLGHHFFEELPDGTLAWQQLDVRMVSTADGEEEWAGDAIAETTPDGVTSVVFSVWDVLEPTVNDYMLLPDFYPGEDWTHGNGLVWHDDHYTLSLGHAGDVLEIDRATGAATVYGVDGVPAEPQFEYQHDAHWLDDGHLLLYSTSDGLSSAIEYELGDDGLREVWRWDTPGMSFYLGQARVLADGNRFVNGAAQGWMWEIDPAGEVVWEMETEDGYGFGQWLLVDDLYAGP